MTYNLLNVKKPTLLLFCLLLTFGSYGQPLDSLTFQVLLNYNMSNISRGKYIWEQPQIGFNAGLEAEWPLHNKWLLKTQLLVSKRGQAFHFSHPVLGSNNLRTNMFYVDLNILAAFRLSPKINVFAGIGLDGMLFNHMKYTEPLPSGIEVESIHYNDPAKMNLSGIIGGTYRIKPRWTANIYYSRGFLALINAHAIRYQFLSLGVLYDLNLSKSIFGVKR